MTAREKKVIYNLLKTASSSINGFTAADFPDVENLFTDDIKLQDTSEIPDTQDSTDSVTDSIALKIHSCTRCELSKQRNHAVEGSGSLSPLVFVIQDSPLFEEDLEGKSCAGEAGAYLDKMLSAVSLSRNTNTYVTNIVKCRSKLNRNPYPEEIEACSSFLDSQLARYKPSFILCMGNICSKALLNTQKNIAELRPGEFEYKGIPLYVTYSAQQILKDQNLRRPVWEDLKKLKAKLLESHPDYEVKV